MYDTIVRTKLTPPRTSKYTHPRLRLTRQLSDAQNFRLTIVHAGPGYGKSTALAGLVQAESSVIWYQLGVDDTDPLAFLSHLIHSCTAVTPDLSPASLARLEEWEQNGRTAPWMPIVDSLINELPQSAPSPLFLVLDDAHHLNNGPQVQQILDRFIGHAPAYLHFILATRYPIALPNLVAWRVRGELLEIGQAALIFTSDEIVSLFRDQYNMTLTADQVSELAAHTEGWPIALQLVGQWLQSGGDATLPEAVARLSGSDLFAYLTQEILAQQAPDVQDFLRVTAVFRQMTPDLCDCLRDADDSRQLLRYLEENGLFVVTSGNGDIRYHHLFRDLLRSQLPPDEIETAHRQAAHCCQKHSRQEEAVYHLLAARDYETAAKQLKNLGRNMALAGRLDTLANWIGSLPPHILENHPPLLVYLGDSARLHSRFDEALAWYKQAETRSRLMGNLPAIGQALRGQARIYLDTVNPSQAEQLLQEALRLSDGQEDRESRARLLELLAENLLNQGRAREAETYREQARELRREGPGEAELSIRVLLRTGQLDQARRLLEKHAEKERQEPAPRPRAHRETLLLLSLILAMQGEAEAAYQCAVEGAERGKALDSPFVTAVGYMRQGHAWLLQKDEPGYSEAYRCFHEAIRISETLDVPRLKIEAYWGLCQAYGFPGDLENARASAENGLKIARAVGDEWVTGCIFASLGASYALAQQAEKATEWLTQAQRTYRECGDSYGEAVSRLWLSYTRHQHGDTARLEQNVTELLRLAQTHGYDYLFQRRTLLGPPDPRALVPILVFARDADIHAVFAQQLLSQMGLDKVQLHPGYQLRLQLLGPFHAWRGAIEIDANAWKRKKARQLFLFLLTHRHAFLEREQIADSLWPELGPEQAQRDFKIAHSALLSVLEPQRGRNAPSAYIIRDGSRYGWCSTADVWLDVVEFETLIKQGNAVYLQDATRAAPLYRQAMALYQGEYLQEFPYEEWCSEKREHLSTLFLQTAERLAAILVQHQDWEEAINVAQVILTHDDCWENAYRILIQAYADQGHYGQAVRAYRRCVERLNTVLGVTPSPITTRLFESLG
ncbi:MAG: transcriptional regulator [Chloroflexi bacterium]|nr:transcriptional regulator [Chloroflexota bacterium]